MALLNGIGISRRTGLKVLAGWDQIHFAETEPMPTAEVEFYEHVRVPVANRLAAVGVESPIAQLSWLWIGLDLLVVRSGLVMVTNPQPALERELAHHGIEAIPVRMRHAFPVWVGLHCTTFDPERDPG